MEKLLIYGIFEKKSNSYLCYFKDELDAYDYVNNWMLSKYIKYNIEGVKAIVNNKTILVIHHLVVL